MRKSHKKATLGIVLCLVLLFPYWIALPPFKQLLLFGVGQKMGAKIQVDHLRLSWLGPQKIKGMHIATPDFEATVRELDIGNALWSIGSRPKTLHLDGGSIVSNMQGVSSLVEEMKATVQGYDINASGNTNTNGQMGGFQIKGNAISNTSFDIAASATNMPSAPVDWFLKAKGLLSTSIGPFFNVNGNFSNHSNSGAFDIQLQAPYAAGIINASYTPTGITLTQDLNVAFMLTRELSLFLTKNKMAIVGADPVNIQLATGSYLPRHFALSEFQIGRGYYKFGRLTLHNPKLTDTVASFLKVTGNQLDAWCCGAFFSLQNGLLELGREDILINQAVHACAWGQINLLNKSVNMTLGIPAETLQSTFGVNNLSPSYVLTLPVGGTLDHLEFDSSTAVTKIGTLVASQAAQQAGGYAGAIGSIASAATQLSDVDVPPPAECPFCWGKSCP